ncbi:MAG: hypothetical protein IJY42_06390 [Clostridia bacterium]|nr:hypothetical protein [Clostridia bacterium]
MTNRDVLDLALSLLAESNISSEVSDYIMRTPALLRLVASDLSAADRALRQSRGVEGAVQPFDFSLDAPFPLMEELSACAAYALASLLVLEEIPELSSTLDKRYRERIPSLGGETVTGAWQVEKTINRYF